MSEPMTVRYFGSLAEFSGQIGCAVPAGDRYDVTLWVDMLRPSPPVVLRGARRESLEFGGVTMGPGLVCRCGSEHDRSGR